jgi:mannose-6-phosphate isomerase-like protein (cupin superfamily)
MTERELIVHAEEIEWFVPKGAEGIYASQCLIEPDGVGSERLMVHRSTVKAGQKLGGGSHPEGYDECYYILSGRARVALGGDPKTGEGSTTSEIGPDSSVFIPGGTFHALNNPYAEDLIFLTLWPKIAPGANDVYDARREAWGTSFRKKAAVVNR